MVKLSKRYQRFVDEYVVDFNGAQAAVRAGYAKKSARIAAARLLTNDNISFAIAKAIGERNKRLKIDQDYVLQRLLAIDRMDIADILEDDGALKPVKEWPQIWRQFVSGIDVSELFDGKGEERKHIGVLKKIKWPDKLKNLGLIGKHVNVQAWKDRIETNAKTKVYLSKEDLLL